MAEQVHEVYVESDGLGERNIETLEMLERSLGRLAIDQTDGPGNADAMVVIGGDGSFLHALRRHDFPDVPVVGINMGTLGFFMDVEPSEEAITTMTRQLATGDYRTKQLPLLEVAGAHRKSPVYAINEVVVEKEKSQAFKASLRIGEGEFRHFVGDGFIFATPQGSTSYSLSAGGPILQEDIAAYVIAPSHPHRSTHYKSLIAPAVVSADTEAVVTVKEVEKRPFHVSVDGHTLEDWPEEQTQVRVRVAPDKRLRVVRLDGHDYFAHVSAAFGGDHDHPGHGAHKEDNATD